MKFFTVLLLLSSTAFAQTKITCTSLSNAQYKHFQYPIEIQMDKLTGHLDLVADENKASFDYEFNIVYREIRNGEVQDWDATYIQPEISKSLAAVKGTMGHYSQYKSYSTCGDSFPGWMCPKKDRDYSYELTELVITDSNVTMTRYEYGEMGKMYGKEDALKLLKANGAALVVDYGNCEGQ
jgi:hypothetical protein